MNRRMLYTNQRREGRAAPVEYKTIPGWDVLRSMGAEELDAMAAMHGIDVTGLNRMKVASALHNKRDAK